MFLVTATVVSRASIAAVLAAGHRLLPLFDASPRLLPSAGLLQPLVRWDALHFLAADYTYDYQWAFLPGTPLLARLLHFGAPNGLAALLWPATLLAVAVDTTTTLHDLTRHHFPRAPALARLAALLSLLPSSPATLAFAPYAEPFFTYLSYKGMLFAARQSWLLATLSFTLAATFRSNAIVLAGYVVWGLVVHPFLAHRKISIIKSLYALLLSLCVSFPFIYHNYTAYRSFCLPPPAALPPWCTHTLPSIYTHVQATYWNVGFLRYWTLSQLPNFILAAPPLALLIAFSVSRLALIAPSVLANLRSAHHQSPESHPRPNDPPLAPVSILPHLLHTLFMCATLFFFSHTQIVLRLAAALPTLYWGAAWLLVRDVELDASKTSRGPPWGKIWVWWSALWGTASLALWVAFLPPA